MERTIVLVDDHSLFRNGLRGLLERCAACRVVGEAASGEEFLAMLPELEADIVFMDFAMPGIDGAQATERALARRPELRIITLSMFGEESYYTRMVQAGARGFAAQGLGHRRRGRGHRHGDGRGQELFSPQLLSSLAGRLRTREDAPTRSFRPANAKSWWPYAAACRTRRSPTNCSSRNVRSTSTAPTSSKRPAVKTPPAWSSMPSAKGDRGDLTPNLNPIPMKKSFALSCAPCLPRRCPPVRSRTNTAMRSPR